MTAYIMVGIFIIGYLMIAFEHRLDINKSAISLFLGVVLWIVYLLNAGEFIPSYHSEDFSTYLSENVNLASKTLSEQITSYVLNVSILEHVGDIAQIILFLMGAMTIVELIDSHDGFSFVKHGIKTKNSVALMWVITFITFFISAILDNLTTAIVMIMILRKLVSNKNRRWLFASMIILAANAGGAFSPIGDVTTIMLWIKGNITSLNTITSLFLPSLASVLVPGAIISYYLKGHTEKSADRLGEHPSLAITSGEKNSIFFIGVGGLVMVPIIKSLTGLPPFLGVMGVLSILWLYTEIIYHKKKDIEESIKFRVSKVIKHIDMSTILFFFGILMAVAALQEAGLLSAMASYLDKEVHNVYLITGMIGVVSSIIDNVPLVAGAMGMYPLLDLSTLSTIPDAAYMASFVADGTFWQLLAYCAGVGGSILIIGSAAGVVVMGLEKITFGWYLKKISLPALIGYIAGIFVYMI